MIQERKKIKYQLFGCMLGCILVLGGFAAAASAQTAPEAKPSPKPVRDGGRDPFRKYEPPKVSARKSTMLVPPSIQQRIDDYKAQKAAAMNARMAAPKPTTALLLEEIQVVGISRTPRGYAAIVEATPIKLTYVVYPGERFYNGQLVAIEDNRLVFRREIVFGDGRREKTMELKALRPPTSVNAMSTAKTASVQNSSDNVKREEKPANSEKP